MKKIAAIVLSSVAALTFASCTCPACGGSGLQVITDSGYVPYTTGNAKTYAHNKTITCVRCKGTGTGTGEFMGYVRATNEVLGTVNHAADTIRHID